MHDISPASQLKTIEEDPFHLCFRAEMTAILAEAIDTLADNERQVLVLYYFEERTIKEVGTVFNIGVSRASQIISAAVTRLRARLQKRLNAPRNQDVQSAHPGHYGESV